MTDSESIFKVARLNTPKNQTACLTVLVPAYNEAGTIEVVLNKLIALGSILREIIVVDDGSKDNTAEVVRNFALSNPMVRFFSLPENQGKTSAIRMALSMANGDVVIVQDADLEYSPSDIPTVIAPILRNDADVVYGSRFLVREAARVAYFYHFVANKTLTFLSNVFTNRNMSDIETCYKAFRRGVIQPLDLSSKGYGMEVEITAMISRTDVRIYEVPISYESRSYEEGKKIGLSDGIMAILYILYYNLVAPYRRSGREYIQTVNDFLSVNRLELDPKNPRVRPGGTPFAADGRGPLGEFESQVPDDGLVKQMAATSLTSSAIGD
jgi:glycosyltransferase involved in cell wall biosynthesis